MKTLGIHLKPSLHFSYSQFFVYDGLVQMPACDWTSAHSDQGFARRKGTVAFGALLEFGRATVVVAVTTYQPRDEYQRVIAVPFASLSGKVIVDGPEETEAGRERSFALKCGSYRLVAAQRITGDDDEAIDLFFEPITKPLERSAVLVADDALRPPTTCWKRPESLAETESDGRSKPKANFCNDLPPLGSRDLEHSLSRR